MSFAHNARTVVAVLAFSIVTADRPLRAQSSAAAGCSLGSAMSLAGASGRRIREVHIVSTPPASVGGFKAPLHVTTRDWTIRQRLLVSAGDTVDSLRIAESLRRIRRLRFLAGAAITASCLDGGAVDLTVATRDGWSMQPRVKVRGSSSALVGLEENNLLGTGRAARVYARTEAGQLAAGAAYSDPSLLGSTIGATVYRDVFRDGTAWGVVANTRDAGAFQPTGVIARASQSARQSLFQGPIGITGDTVRRAAASLLLAQRVRMSASGGIFLQFGIEGERTVLAASSTMPLIGPASVRRSFVGADVGLARHTLRYASVPWLSPPTATRDPLLANASEVPLGWTADGLLGIGRDFAARQPAAHLDLWAGRVWALGRTADLQLPRALLVSDVWASGFRTLGRSSSDWSAGSLHTSFVLALPAPRGLWTARLSAERLLDPDPDSRSLAMSDPLLRAIPAASRLAESTVSGVVDRTHHLVDVPGGYMLGASLFAAGSMRWDPAVRSQPAAFPISSAPFGTSPFVVQNGVTDAERLYVGSVGAGILLTPRRFGRSTIRFDVGYPVLRSSQVARRPYLSISIVPALGMGRQRTGVP